MLEMMLNSSSGTTSAVIALDQMEPTHRADIISVAVESDSQNDTECRCKQHACGETRVFLTFEKRQDDEQDRGYAEGDPIICDV